MGLGALRDLVRLLETRQVFSKSGVTDKLDSEDADGNDACNHSGRGFVHIEGRYTRALSHILTGAFCSVQLCCVCAWLVSWWLDSVKKLDDGLCGNDAEDAVECEFVSE